MQINHLDQKIEGAFIAMDAETVAGRITYTQTAEGNLSIDHTEVNPDYRGQDIGKKLVMAAALYARQAQIKIIPLCPFAKRVFEKNPDIQDLMLSE